MMMAVAHLALVTPSLLLISRPTPSTRAAVRCQTPDPFRPARPPVEPMVINAIQELLGGKKSAADVAASALQVRAA